MATGLGVLSAASGVALTATAGWLIARSAEHPPVLVLMVAIVGVRLFGLARPVLRYAERLLSHDLALTELAERRARVFEAVVPLVPGALGPARGDLLTSSSTTSTPAWTAPCGCASPWSPARWWV